MGNVAVIKDGFVLNVVAVEHDTREGTRQFWESQGCTCVDDAFCSPGDQYVDGQFIPAPIPEPPPTWVITRNALQNRFPKTSNGVSTKYDLATLFLNDSGYAESLDIWPPALYELRSLLIAANNRLGVVSNVDLKSQETIDYITMMTNAAFPDVFRLTQAEADAILNTPAQPNEQP